MAEGSGAAALTTSGRRTSVPRGQIDGQMASYSA
jgi:hypothetical protein